MWGWHFLLLDSYISDTCLLLLFFLLDIEPFYYWRKSQNKQRIRGQICQNFRIGNLINCFFKRIARFVWAKERKCDSLIFLANHSVAFLKEQREQIAQGCSFVISDLSKWLTVAICLVHNERFEHGRSLKKSYWGKSNASNLPFGIKRGGSVKNIQKYEFFQIFLANCSFLRVTRAMRSFIRATWAIRSRSAFVMSNLSKLLTVTL